MQPDHDTAAIKAVETLIKYRVSTAPVSSLPILKAMPGVIVTTFAELANRVGDTRQNVLNIFGSDNRDVVTTVSPVGGKLTYVIAYNQRLPVFVLQKSLARELGHIVLKHDGTKPEEVREEEARIFARHLLYPRPLIRALQDNLSPLTVEMVGNITGCYDRCLGCIRKTPGAHVPAELNKLVKEQFQNYIDNLLECRNLIISGTEPVDFGSYMDGYEE